MRWIWKFFSLTLALPAFASDGLLEINQTCAVQTGCFPGDSPGFPVQITTGGSFRLTGNLAVPDGASAGIAVQAPGTRIDLNGFSISSTNQCTGSPPTCSGSGASIGIDAENTRDVGVKSGRVAGFSNTGISLFDLGSVTDLTVEANGNGISAGEACVIANVIVRSNETLAIQVGAASRIVASVIDNNTQGVIAPPSALLLDDVITRNPGRSISGGASPRGTLCDDHRCPSLRRFYKTINAVQGGAALAACDPGFHMASRFEIEDVSNLSYDTVRGWAPPAGNPTSDDQGFGPPAGFPGAWIRTGSFGFSSTTPGTAHCNAWQFSTATGTTAAISSSWTAGASPWGYSTLPCSSTAQVWCVED
jgi:hypothetical protein